MDEFPTVQPFAWNNKGGYQRRVSLVQEWAGHDDIYILNAGSGFGEPRMPWAEWVTLARRILEAETYRLRREGGKA